jgi:tRNA threonylcarbamoyladenosine biosynthesis protein TsaE
MKLLLSNLTATQELAECLSDFAEDTAIYALQGTLGAGKTTLVQALGRRLGVEEVINSPTFTMFNEYHSGRLPLYHLDLYRGGETGEKIDLSYLALELDELMEEPGILVLEWPQYFLVGEEQENYLKGKDYLYLDLRVKNLPDCLKEMACNPQAINLLQKQKEISLAIATDNSHINDGFEEVRVATLESFGARSGKIIRQIREKLSDIVINI